MYNLIYAERSHSSHSKSAVADFLQAKCDFTTTMLVELFSLGVPLKRYERISVKNRRFHSNRGLWSFIWYTNLDRSFFHFVTMHTFDRQTDRQNSHR